MSEAVLKFRNYEGSIEYDEEGETLHGKVLHVRDLITYEAETAKGLKRAFHDSVNDYSEISRGDGRNRAGLELGGCLKKPRFAWDRSSPLFVIPAKAGIHFRLCPWSFAWTSSLPAGEDADAAIYIHLIRSGPGRGAPSRESESNAKTKAKP